MPCPVGDCFSSYVVIKYKNPTPSTKSSISVTSLVLFVTFTLQLLFAWFPACVCDCVTNFAFCHHTLRIDSTFLKIKLYLQIGFISRKLTNNTKAYNCVTSLFDSSTIFLFFTWFSASVSAFVTYFSISALSIIIASLEKMYLKLVLYNVSLTNNTIAYACVTRLFFTLTIFLFFT